jgi:hypothetical protein
MQYTISPQPSTKVSGFARLCECLLSQSSLVLVVTTLAQASTSLASTCIAVLGPFLREEFGFSRMGLGVFVSTNQWC